MAPAERMIWIVDENIIRLYKHLLPNNFIPIRAVESEKNLYTVTAILERLREYNGTRETYIVAIGGGITQDLVAFAASSYMRGIRWIFYPTTMLSMVDSCIGGKSSINVGRYKNLAGNFYPPDQVIINTQFCETLSRIQIIEGLCEAAKICYAHSDNTFQQYLTLSSRLPSTHSAEQLAEIVTLSLNTKRFFIEEDEFDQGSRRLLNLGHTFGHAIESATNHVISHGVAVGLGILSAQYFSIQSGFVTDKCSNLERLNEHIKFLLKEVPKLDENLAKLFPEEALKFLLSDKKHSAHKLILIVFDGQGRLQQVALPRSDELNSKFLATFKFLGRLSYEI
jgi:3-dehydroquinate synthase